MTDGDWEKSLKVRHRSSIETLLGPVLSSKVCSTICYGYMPRGEMSTSRWMFAGFASDFPNIESTDSNIRLSDSVLTPTSNTSSLCKVLQPSTDTNAKSTLLTPTDAVTSVGLKEQILIFQYRGKFHAVDHQCPHRSFPLSRGTLYDIEDFGIKLSVGLTCPKHGWAFDVHTGESDRGAYRLRIWDVEARTAVDEQGGNGEREIWVRQKVEE